MDTIILWDRLTSEGMSKNAPSVSNALEKLYSFDADLRFMGLNDIQEEVSSGACATPSIRKAVIERLNDRVGEVQNQAVKTLTVVAKKKETNTDEFLRDIHAQGLPLSTQAVAVRTVVDAAPRNNQNVPKVVLEIVSHGKEGLLERLDALLSLVKKYGPQLDLNQVESVFGFCTSLSTSSGLLSRRALDVLVEIAPYQQLEHLATFVNSGKPIVSLRLLARLERQLGREIAKKIPDMDKKILNYARMVLDDGEEAVELSESAVRAAAQLGIRDSKLVDALILWNPGDKGGEGMSLDNDEEDVDEFELEDESEELDESYRIRKAAAAFAVTMAPEESARASLQRALASEHDAGVRTDLTEALRAFVGPDSDIFACIVAAERDRDESSLHLLRDLGPWMDAQMAQQTLKLVKELASSKRRLVRPSLEVVKSIKRSNKDSDAVILAGLAGDHHLQTFALQTAQSLKCVEAVGAACNVIKNTRDLGLRTLGLQFVADNVPSCRALDTAGLSLQLIRTEPSSRVPAAYCLSHMWQRGLTFDTSEAVRVLSEVLSTQPLIPAVGTACLYALESAPVSDEVANAALRVASDRLHDKQAKVLTKYVKYGGKNLICPILEWSSSRGSFPDLIEACAAVEPERCLQIAQNLPPVVQAAAFIGARRVPSTPVSYELAAELALRGHSVLSMEFLLLHPCDSYQVWGRVLGASCSSTSELETLPNDVWNVAAEIAAQRLPSSEFWARLRGGRGTGALLGTLVVEDDDASKISEFPNLRVQAATSALSKIITDELATQLVGILLSTSEEDSDAASAVGWALKSRPNIFSHKDSVLSKLSSVAINRDKNRVRVMQVGPFKHRIDDGLPVRLAAYESLAILLPLCTSSDISEEVVDSAVHGLSDEGDVPVTATRLLGTLGDLKVESIASRAKYIRERFDAEVNRKVKDSMPKQDHDRRTTLLRTIESTRSHLNHTFDENGLAVEL